MNKLTLLFVGLLLLLVACGPGKYDEFAQCLTDSDATFYGAFWCPHCSSQKELFEGSMDFVNYVECSLPDKSGQTTVCKKANITSYPTWEFADGERETGVVTLEKLAERTDCSLPEA